MIDLLSSRFPDSRIIATTRKSQKPDSLAEWALEVDFREKSALKRLSEMVQKKNSDQLNVICCVGRFYGFDSLLDTEPQDAEQVLADNLVTVFNIAQHVLPLMIESGGGHFCAMSSHSVGLCPPLLAPYLSAKSGLETLVRSIANEYGGAGITANTFCLGTIDTVVERELRSLADHNEWLLPQEVAGVVVDFISSSYFRYINGNSIQVYRFSKDYFSKGYFERIGINRLSPKSTPLNSPK